MTRPFPQTPDEARLCVHQNLVWFGHECGLCDLEGEYVWDNTPATEECIAEFGEHEDHWDCARMLQVMKEEDDFDYTSIDYPEFDPQTDHFERFGRPAFPNEY